MLSRRNLAGAGLALLAPAAQAAAPLRGGQAPGWYRFRVGAFECTVVSDGHINLGAPHPTFGGTAATPAELEAALRGAFLPTDALLAEVNCLVVNTGRELVLLDAGVGPRPLFGPTTGRIGTALRAADIEPGEIDLVAFTHAHPDHAFGLADNAGNSVFPAARYAVSATDFQFWTDERNLGLPEPLRSFVEGTRAVFLPRRDRFTLLTADAEIVPGIRALPTPGHTPGHVAFHVESRGERLLVAGDVANHHVLALARPDWPFGFDSDAAQASVTRRRFFDMAAADRVTVLGYHFPWPGLGHVEARGQGFGWTPAAWRWG